MRHAITFFCHNSQNAHIKPIPGPPSDIHAHIYNHTHPKLPLLLFLLLLPPPRLLLQPPHRILQLRHPALAEPRNLLHVLRRDLPHAFLRRPLPDQRLGRHRESHVLGPVHELEDGGGSLVVMSVYGLDA